VDPKETEPPHLLLVVPCYNEANRLRPQCFLEFIVAHPDVGFRFVDDGSTDETPSVLAEMQANGNGRIATLTLRSNVGKAGAVQRGIIAAFEERPALVGYWDADLSTPLSEVPRFVDLLDRRPDVDIAIGARVKMLGRRIRRRPVRHYAGRLFATAASVALGLAVYDTQCGAKVFRANDAVRQLFTQPLRSPWAMDVEILARYVASRGRASAGERICEVPLYQWTDVPGSKLRLWSALRALWSVFGVWWGLTSNGR
jgi:glycosyltransferase involved in cell wall biosynthesis